MTASPMSFSMAPPKLLAERAFPGLERARARVHQATRRTKTTEAGVSSSADVSFLLNWTTHPCMLGGLLALFQRPAGDAGGPEPGTRGPFRQPRVRVVRTVPRRPIRDPDRAGADGAREEQVPHEQEHAAVLALQRTAGNAAVAAWLSSKPGAAPFIASAKSFNLSAPTLLFSSKAFSAESLSGATAS